MERSRSPSRSKNGKGSPKKTRRTRRTGQEKIMDTIEELKGLISKHCVPGAAALMSSAPMTLAAAAPMTLAASAAAAPMTMAPPMTLAAKATPGKTKVPLATLAAAEAAESGAAPKTSRPGPKGWNEFLTRYIAAEKAKGRTNITRLVAMKEAGAAYTKNLESQGKTRKTKGAAAVAAENSDYNPFDDFDASPSAPAAAKPVPTKPAAAAKKTRAPSVGRTRKPAGVQILAPGSLVPKRPGNSTPPSSSSSSFLAAAAAAPEVPEAGNMKPIIYNTLSPKPGDEDGMSRIKLRKNGKEYLLVNSDNGIFETRANGNIGEYKGTFVPSTGNIIPDLY